ncbi:MAG: hypothetical protein HY752_07305 [Nitrospirae bacterium]|nr:hypothetical protein [Nitrospirota bacterium]
MTIIEYIKDGFRLTHKNWQLIAIQIATMFIIFLGFILFVGVPLAIAFVYFGVDLTQAKDFLNILKNPLEYLSRYFWFVIFIITILIVYICFVSILSMFAFGGTLGVLRNSFLAPQYKFSFSSFFKEGKSLFPQIVGFALILLLVFIVISFIFGIFSGIGFSLIDIYGKMAFPLLFIAYFFALLLIGSSLLITFVVLTLSAFALTILSVEKTGAITAFKKSFNFIKNKPRSILFYAVLFGGYMVIDFILIILNFPFSLIPLVGVLINIPYQIFSYVLLSYLVIVVSSSLIIFYIKNTDYPLHTGAYEI